MLASEATAALREELRNNPRHLLARHTLATVLDLKYRGKGGDDAVIGRALLLVLDNCEHLIEEVTTLAASLLSACSRLKILATSRAKAVGGTKRRVELLDPEQLEGKHSKRWILESYPEIRDFALTCLDAAIAEARQAVVPLVDTGSLATLRRNG